MFGSKLVTTIVVIFLVLIVSTFAAIAVSKKVKENNLILFQAIMRGKINSVRKYLENAGDPNVLGPGGYTAISMAAFTDHYDIVALLKEYGAKTDFFIEVSLGNVDTVKKYIDSGIDVNKPSSHGHQALMLAAHQGHDAVVKLLIDANANIEARHSYSGNTALIGAAYQGRLSTVKLLIKEKADINATNKSNKNALQMAQSKGHKEIVDVLLKAGGSN